MGFANNKHSGYSQRADFGVDEYLKICREFDIEPNIDVGTCRELHETADHVEYCNGDTTTY